MSKYKNSLTNAPIIKNPKLYVHRKIVDKSGAVIGMSCCGNIYDLNKTFWGKVGKKEKELENQRRIFNGQEQKGYIDANKNIFSPDGDYYGTIKRRIFFILLFPLLSILIICFAFSAVISSYIIEKVGRIIDYKNVYATIEVRQESDNNNWIIIEELDVFKNSKFGNKNKIAPSSQGSYGFVLENKEEAGIKYSIKMSDENEDKIPMRYRLKIGDTYIIGDESTWVDISQMEKGNLTLPLLSMTTYTLEWKWDGELDHKADTIIGFGEGNPYKLTIAISSEFKN